MDSTFIPHGLSMIAFIGAVVIFIGELVALKYKKNLTRLLIFSCIAETGYVLLGLGIGSFDSITGAILHLEYQTIMRGLVFFTAFVIIENKHSNNIEKLRGIGISSPILAIIFGFGIFSVMGLSPFKGSISKFLIIYSAIQSAHWIYGFIAIFGSIIEAVYFLYVIQEICFEKKNQNGIEIKKTNNNFKISNKMMTILISLTGLTILMGLFPDPFIKCTEYFTTILIGNTYFKQIPKFDIPWSTIVLVPYIGAFILYIVGYFSKILRNSLAIIITAITVYLVYINGNIDKLSYLFALITAGISFLITVYSIGYIKSYSNRYFFFLLLLIGTLLGVTTSKSFGNFYVFWELMTWSSYLLVIHKQTTKALKAGFKYFIMCTTGAYIMLYAILALHVKIGSFNMDIVSKNIHLISPTMLLLTIGMFIIGFGVKAGLFPLHDWLPDAHSNCPSSISAPMSGILTKMGVYGLVRVLFVVFGIGVLTKLGTTDGFTNTGLIISILGACTLLFGEIMALRQSDIKRMLAYSTMAQVGEIVTTLGVGTYLSFVGSFYHILNHAIMKDLLFLAAGILIFRLKSQEITKFKGIGRELPFTSLCFGIGILAIMGLPPFNGFISKFLMLYAIIQANHIGLAIVLLFGSIIGCFYYTRVLKIIFFEKYEGPKLKEAPLSMLVPIGILTFLVVFIGIYPQAGMALVKPAADFIALKGHMLTATIPNVIISWPLMVKVSILGALITYIVGRKYANFSGRLAVLTISITLIVAVLDFSNYDIFSWSFAFLIAFVGLLNMFYSLGYMKHEHAKNRFYMFFLLMISGLLGVAVSKDLFNFFVFWEIMSSWTLYFVIIHEQTKVALKEGFKYFIFNYIGASIMFLGMIILTAKTGIFNMSELPLFLANIPKGYAALGFILMLIGFLMKAAMLPIRIDYQMHPVSAPTPVSGYISSVLLKSAPFGIAKLFYIFGGVSLLSSFGMSGNIPTIMYLTAWIGGITIVVGAALALLQSNMKLLLIYHTVSQMGYIILGISLDSSLSVAGGLLHLVNHMFFKDLLFLVAGVIMVQTGIGTLDKLGGLGKKMPITLGLFIVGAFSIAGIPPFNGFTSKWIIYHAAMDQNCVFLALLAMVGSVLTLASFMKFLHSAFFGQLPKELENVTEAPWTMLSPMIILTSLCIIFGIFPGLPLDVIAHIENACLDIKAVSFTLFGINSITGSWNAGIVGVLLIIAFVLGSSIYFIGKRKTRYTKIYTCGIANLEPEEIQVNAHNLYESPKKLVNRFIKRLKQIFSLDRRLK